MRVFILISLTYFALGKMKRGTMSQHNFGAPLNRAASLLKIAAEQYIAVKGTLLSIRQHSTLHAAHALESQGTLYKTAYSAWWLA